MSELDNEIKNFKSGLESCRTAIRVLGEAHVCLGNEDSRKVINAFNWLKNVEGNLVAGLKDLEHKLAEAKSLGVPVPE